MRNKTLLLAETTIEQNITPRSVLRAVKGLEADLAFFGASGVEEAPKESFGCCVKRNPRPEDVWGYRAGIFLNPSLKTLSKLAHVIIDDPCMDLLYEFLVCEQPLFFPCIYENPSLFGLPKGLRKKAVEFMREAEQMGVKILHGSEEKGQSAIECPELLITEAMVGRLEAGQTIIVKQEAVFTPLAMDLIRAKKIQVQRRQTGG